MRVFAWTFGGWLLLGSSDTTQSGEILQSTTSTTSGDAHWQNIKNSFGANSHYSSAALQPLTCQGSVIKAMLTLNIVIAEKFKSKYDRDSILDDVHIDNVLSK